MPSKPRHEPYATRCTGKTKAGARCKNRAILGATVCRKHGGNLPRVKKKAEETVAQWRMRRALDLDKVLDPLLSVEDGAKLRKLINQHPAMVPRLLDLADRFRGGAKRVELQQGPDRLVEAALKNPRAREAMSALLEEVTWDEEEDADGSEEPG